MINVLVFSDRRYPIDHSFLEGVIERRIASDKEISVTWILQSSSKVFFSKRIKWLYSDVIIIPNFGKENPLLFMLGYFYLLIVFPFIFIRYNLSFEIIYIRNDPFFLFFAHIIKIFKKVKIIFQISHFKEEEILENLKGKSKITKTFLFFKAKISLFVRNTLGKRVDIILPISSTMLQVLHQYSFPIEKMVTFPLGVDPELNKIEKNYPLSPLTYNYCIYIGTIAKIRRIDITIKAFAKFVKTRPNSKLKLVILGGNTASIEMKELEDIVEKFQLKKRIIFISQVSRNEVIKYLKFAKFAFSVIPSKGILKTISPTKLMEYLQFKCPVIATSGIPEQDKIIIESSAGVLINFNIYDISNAIIEFDENEKELQKMSVLGYKYIINNRSYDVMAKKMKKIILELKNNE